MGNFTQPICDPCWLRSMGQWEEDEDGNYIPISYPIPTIVSGHPLEMCCMCGDHTIAGIYIRRDPAHVPYPTVIPDEAL